MSDENTDAAEAQDDSEGGSVLQPEAPKSIREFVESERAKRAAAESTSGKSEEPAEDARDDDETEKTDPATTKPAMYTDEEMASMDLREAELDRVPSAVRETVRRLQAAERKKHTVLNEKARELDDLIARAKSGLQSTKAEPAEPEEDLSFSKEELRQIFRSKVGKQFLAEAFEEIGMPLDVAKDLADRQFMQSAVADATGEFPSLAEPAFFEAVVALIRDTPRWAKLVKESSDKTSVSLVFQAAAGRLRDTQISAEHEAVAAEKRRTDEEKKKVKAAKETAGRKPASHAAGAARKGNAQAGERPSILEFVTQARADRNS